MTDLHDEYDDASGALDLSPRETAGASGRPPRRSRNWMPIAILALVLVAGGVIVTQFLRSAVDYYCNVDEVGTRDGCDPGRRIRLQGTVDEGSVEVANRTTRFTISFNGATMPVTYDGEPGGIFKECIPVVVHGVIENQVLLGDRVEVKHSENYVAKHDDRIDEANDSACVDDAA